ncbi:MAG: AmmeMemoRadiSam system protein A [Actinomycetota bacterium]|nr:AmmeMemoRadiSam system protein A [Actinomycetota bacterium]
MSPKNDAPEHSPQARLAREAIEAWVREGKKISSASQPDLQKLLSEKSAAFVSIKKKGSLRGCIGTFQPTRDSLAEEIIGNAISAASRDPRFPPLREEELEDVDIGVDVLGEPEPIPDAGYLDPRRFGVIVRSGNRLGLLLPDLEGVDTVDQQLEIARRKAGIASHEPVQLLRFTVERYH